uniref:DNA polymerase n=4 Tax=Clastoptera arizonana TaxID=38151 RepID=A0A1B6DGY7_9HEMI
MKTSQRNQKRIETKDKIIKKKLTFYEGSACLDKSKETALISKTSQDSTSKNCTQINLKTKVVSFEKQRIEDCKSSSDLFENDLEIKDCSPLTVYKNKRENGYLSNLSVCFDADSYDAMNTSQFSCETNESLDSTIDNGIVSFYDKTFCEDFFGSQCSSSSTANDIFKCTLSSTKSVKHYVPLKDPPHRLYVKENLSKLGFPEVINECPFYSEPSHVGESSEIGGRVLKVCSKTSLDLEEYNGSFSFMSKWQNIKFQELGLSQVNVDSVNTVSLFTSGRKTIIAPLKPAPTPSRVKLWIKTKSLIDNLKSRQEEKEEKPNRIVIPSSPLDNLNSDDEEIISASPCTPLTKDDDDDHVNPQVQKTPQEPDIKKSTDFITSTPMNNSKDLLKGKAKRTLGLQLLPRRSSQLSLPPVVEEMEETLCDQINTTAPTSQESNITKQDSNLSSMLLDSQFQKQFMSKRSLSSTSCVLDGATPDNSGGYRMDLENLHQVRPVIQHQYLTTLTMELHVQTRGELRPDPQCDFIGALFYNITNDCPEQELKHITGAIIVGKESENKNSFAPFRCQLCFVKDEKELIQEFVRCIHLWDPDILAGYEIEMLSWGYLLQRAYVLSINLKVELSRVLKGPSHFKELGNYSQNSEEANEELNLTGRIILNVWRFLRHEVALMSYSFENVMYHILHQRVPLFSFKTLTSWWSHRTHLHRWKTVEHYITKVEGIVKLLDQLDLIGRTSELARLFGIQFYEVLSRGSQFRVESMMLRIAKPQNYIAVSPSIKQRAKMRAPEYLPLIMEPESRLYCDPVIVLDFQSLYPSMIIAYNYCFSTCLGRVEHLGKSEIFEFGCTQLRVPIKTIHKVENDLNFSPCGVAFVKETIRKGVLPQMLEEILNTRLMVKKSMKNHKDNKTLQRVLHARQLGLKLIANVTYGYTSANFSGRMPSCEVADSVVSKGRETLERAINLVKHTSKWGAKVIYGDTDSLFVLTPGKSRAEAFKVGAEIAEAVTNSNPKPVKLKLEKVYQPCILQTKKRYVGYSYESPDQEKPTYDAKGIETVRRDGCPAVTKILEKSLKILFETKDVSLVKKYVTRQFSKIILGRISIQELTFAREYRGAGGYKPGACVPALELAKQWRATDPRSEPRVGERVPHVIIAGPPGLPLIRLVRSPTALLLDPSLKIYSEYYLTRVIIPPLDRCFSLIGVSVGSWYSDLPRKQFISLPTTIHTGNKKSTISQYFSTMNCVVCQKLTQNGVCLDCQVRPQIVALTLSTKLSLWERRYSLLNKICQSCCRRTEDINCISLDCPVLYQRNQAIRDMNQADFINQLSSKFLTF